LPDELIGLNFLLNAANQTLESFTHVAEGYGDLQSTEKENWLIIKPYREYSTRHLRVDREVLGKYLRSIVEEGRASLAAQAEFALNSPPTDYDTFGMAMGMLLDVNSTQNIDKDWITLKLWGALSLEQQNDLIKGQKLPFKNLTAAQMALVEREAYDRPIKNFGGRHRSYSDDDLLRSLEPTECLPNGLSPDGSLSLQTTGSQAILASSTTKNVRMSYARLFDEQQLGSSLAYYENARADQNPMFDRFQLVKRVSYDFSYTYSEKVLDSTNLHDVVVPPDSVAVALADLPSAIRDKILAAKESAKNNPGFGTVVKTPPPNR
jgi:hypothetical protein